MNVTVLVDFDNDSVGTALAVADALGDRLWGVRLDTSETLIDVALRASRTPTSTAGSRRCSPARVRAALDDAGHEHVRIVVSGGFDAAKIERFEAESTPVDAYGVGSSLLRGGNDFTADSCASTAGPVSKVGREERPNDRLERVVY